jgi:hypothetical protein
VPNDTQEIEWAESHSRLRLLDREISFAAEGMRGAKNPMHETRIRIELDCVSQSPYRIVMAAGKQLIDGRYRMRGRDGASRGVSAARKRSNRIIGPHRRVSCHRQWCVLPRLESAKLWIVRSGRHLLIPIAKRRPCVFVISETRIRIQKRHKTFASHIVASHHAISVTTT